MREFERASLSTWCKSALAAFAMLATPLISRADLCADVSEFRDGSRDFASLRGAPASEPNTWAVSRTLIDPSLHCQIEGRADDEILRCTTDWGDNANKLRQRVVELGHGLRNCFGDAWKHRVQRGSGRTTAIYYPPDGGAEFDAFVESREKPGAVAITDVVGVPLRRQLQWRFGVVLYRLSVSESAVGRQEPLPDALQFCDALQQVVAAADTRFESLRGAKSQRSWEATLSLPTLTQCDITDYDTSITYGCRVGDYDSRGALRRQQEAMAALVTRCLGAAWAVTRRPRGNGVWSYGIGRIGRDGDDDPVSVTLRGRKRDDAYLLYVDVDRSTE